VKSLLALLLLIAFATPEAFAQANNGELRLNVVDPSGLGIEATVQIAREANQFNTTTRSGPRRNEAAAFRHHSQDPVAALPRSMSTMA